MISCVILSAGLSIRFGAPKATASINNSTVIEHIQHTLLSTEVGEIIIVLGAHKNEIEPYVLNHKKVKAVYNKDYKFGQTSSFQVGLKNISHDSKGVFLLPIDYPLIKATTIDNLIHYFNHRHSLILIPTHQSQPGHPPLFNISLKESLLSFNTNSGINTFIHEHKNNVEYLELDDPAIRQTFNTPQEFDRLKENI